MGKARDGYSGRSDYPFVVKCCASGILHERFRKCNEEEVGRQVVDFFRIEETGQIVTYKSASSGKFGLDFNV